MHLVFAADDNYIMPSRVMLSSFLRSNPGSHDVWFFYCQVAPESLSALEKTVTSFGSAFHPMVVDVAEFAVFSRNKQFTVETWFRLLIPSVLPETVDRALWLDGDIVVNGSLEEFYHMPLEDAVLAGCPDLADHREKLKALGCPEGSVYINAGVLLMNLNILRRFSLDEYREVYLAHREKITWFDQDVINCIFAGKIRVLRSDVYNRQLLFDSRLTRSERKTLRSTARIVHFIGGRKPWHRIYISSAAALWEEAYAVMEGRGKFWLLCCRGKRVLLRYTWLPACEAQHWLYNTPFVKKIRKMAKKLLKR